MRSGVPKSKKPVMGLTGKITRDVCIVELSALHPTRVTEESVEMRSL